MRRDAVAVLKFGGSSVPDVAAHMTLARHLCERLGGAGERLAIVVSAMPGETEGLRIRLQAVDPHPAEETVAGLLTLADTVSAHLLATALRRLGATASVLAGHQTGFRTAARFAGAELAGIDPAPLAHALDRHDVVLIPGGQAVDDEGRPTWLGKNSSDLSAVAVAVAVGASRVEIHSDVAGIYSADPHLVVGARLLPRVSYDAASTLSLYGAKVLHRGAVSLAREHRVEIVCRLNEAPFEVGTVIAASGDEVDAVILNLNSVVLRLAGRAEAERAHDAFGREGIDTVLAPTEPVLAVVGGYVDVEAVRARHGISATPTTAVPITEVRGRTVRMHLAADAGEAIELTQHIHDTTVLPEGVPS